MHLLTNILALALILPVQLYSIGGPALVTREGAQHQTDRVPAQQIDADSTVADFMAGETESRLAFSRYGFKRDLLIQSIGGGDQVTGEYHRVSQFTVDGKGKRQEKVITFPKPTLTAVVITKDDLEDFDGASQFLMNPPGSDNYAFSFVRREPVGDTILAVFDVKPEAKAVKKGRLFEGRIWVEAKSKRIIVLYGRKVMASNQVFPVMRIDRVVIDGIYYFPGSISSDQQLTFPTGGSAHLRISAKYSDYTRT